MSEIIIEDGASIFNPSWTLWEFVCVVVPIITVSLNAEKYIEKTILSVINQDYNNIEYIIIDGKSKDRTIEIIKKYERKIKIWISETDSGIYDAMNKGIKFSKGDWINVMNAGDTFVSSKTVSLIMSSK